MSAAVDLGKVRTIDQVISRAREVIGPGPYGWASVGAGEGVTVARNRVALDQLALVPQLMRDVSVVDTRTSFLGIPLALPVMLAPVGSTILFHPDSAVAVAQGATRAGTSSFCATLTRAPWEDVARTAPGRHLFQLYIAGGRTWLDEVVDRVEAAGFAAICLTADSVVASRRDGLAQTGFDWRVEREGLPENLVRHGRDDEYKKKFTWTEFEWLCHRANVPVILKGVLRATDAARAIDCGAAGIYVSNHGGRSVDHEISTIEALEDVVTAVAGRVEVVIDGGFTRGADVCKALALGAKAVSIGRLQCWALALAGADGVAHVLSILQDELSSTMALLGCRTVDEFTPEHARWSFLTRRPSYTPSSRPPLSPA